MYQKFTKTETAANMCSVMECRNHLKNAVSPKNQRSRGNFVICGLLLLVFWGGTNKVVGQTWYIGHNPTPNSPYLSTVTATLNGNTLTISGNGNMADFWCTGTNQYDAGGEAPWWFNPAHRNAIHTVVFQSGSNVQNIGKKAFKECINLQTIVIPNSVTKINAQAFYSCSNLTSITIPSSVNTIVGEAFSGCGNLRTVELTNGNIPLDFIGYQSNNICSGTNYNTYNWFQNCPVQTLHLGREITWGTDNNTKPIYYIKNTLTNLTIGSTVNTIGERAFQGCNLQVVKIQEKNSALTLTGYSGQQFNCNIDTLYLGRDLNVTNAFGKDIFARNLELKYVKIGQYVTTIINDCFTSCPALQSLIFENGINLISIGSNAFQGCNHLSTPLNIPPSTQSTTIGEYAFAGCSMLPSLFIPQSVSTIGQRAFQGCNGLKVVNIQEKNSALTLTGYSGQQFNCNIDTLYLGRNLNVTNALEPNAGIFKGNLELKYVKIGEYVTTINDNCFRNCNIINAITSLPCPPPTVGSNAFYGVPNHIPIYPNCTCLSDYRSQWNYFTNFICPEPPVITTTTLPSGFVGTAYNQTLNATSTTPVTWSLANGNLPNGLTLSGIGVISGMPTTAGTFNFTVYATNSAGTVSQELSIKIDGVGIIENDMVNIRIYPNPTTGELRIESGEWRMENAEYHIYNVMGQMVLQGKLPETSVINVTSLPSGIYYLKLAEATVKFVKE